MDLTQCGQAFISTRMRWASTFALLHSDSWLSLLQYVLQTVCRARHHRPHALWSRVYLNPHVLRCQFLCMTFDSWRSRLQYGLLRLWPHALWSHKYLIPQVMWYHFCFAVAFQSQFDTGDLYVSIMDLTHCDPNCISSLKYWDIRIFLFVFHESYLGFAYTRLQWWPHALWSNILVTTSPFRGRGWWYKSKAVLILLFLGLIPENLGKNECHWFQSISDEPVAL